MKSSIMQQVLLAMAVASLIMSGLDAFSADRVESSALRRQQQQVEKTEETIVELCLSLLSNKAFEHVKESVAMDACSVIYEQLGVSLEDNNQSGSGFDRARRFFAIPAAKNQHGPSHNDGSNTGFKYGRR